MLIPVQSQQGMWFPANQDEIAKMVDEFELGDAFVRRSVGCIVHRKSDARINFKRNGSSSGINGLIWSGAMMLHKLKLLR